MIAFSSDGCRDHSRHLSWVAGCEGRALRRAIQFFGKLGEHGVTTVEFAIVGGLFLTLLLAVFELGFMVFVQSVLDSSARSAARLIRTGQAQGSANAQTYFQNALCNGVNSIIGCSNIVYQSQKFADWGSTQTALNTPPPRDPKTGKVVSVGFTAGNCGEIVAVQVMYDYKFFTPWIGSLLGGSSNSSFLMSTVVFQNEPFCSSS
jgi:Flp pilus assembly protein TadG